MFGTWLEAAPKQTKEEEDLREMLKNPAKLKQMISIFNAMNDMGDKGKKGQPPANRNLRQSKEEDQMQGRDKARARNRTKNQKIQRKIHLQRKREISKNYMVERGRWPQCKV